MTFYMGWIELELSDEEWLCCSQCGEMANDQTVEIRTKDSWVRCAACKAADQKAARIDDAYDRKREGEL